MRKTELKKYEKLLLAKRAEILKEMGIIRETHMSSTMKDATGDLSSYSYHMADQGTDAMERELAIQMASKSGRFLYHVEDALRRIQNNTYGKCFKCNKNISSQRLAAVPHARQCIECKSLEESKKTGRK